MKKHNKNYFKRNTATQSLFFLKHFEPLDKGRL